MLGNVLFVHPSYGVAPQGLVKLFKKRAIDCRECGMWDVPEVLKQYSPSVTFVFHPWLKEFGKELETLQTIPGHKFLWSWEEPWEIDYTAKYASFFTNVITQDKNSMNVLQGRVGKGIHIPHGVDIEIFKPQDIAYEFRSDICFVGAAYPSRLQFLRTVLPQLKDYMVSIVGTGWEFLPNTDNQKVINNGCSGYDYVRYINGAKININLHRKSLEVTMANETKIEASSPNNRCFEIPACNAFELVDELRCPELYDYYPQNIIPTFSDAADFVAKIKYYLEHSEERKQKAQSAYEATLALHTYEHRVQKLMEFMP